MAARKKIPRTRKAQRKFGRVMREFERGTLRSGSKHGPKVTKPAQARAIAASEARKSSRKRKGGR